MKGGLRGVGVRVVELQLDLEGDVYHIQQAAVGKATEVFA